MAIIYTAGIEQSLDKIFAGILIGEIDRANPLMSDKIRNTVSCLNRFIATFPTNIFKDEFAIFYEIIVTFNAKSFTANQLDSIIDNNRDLILDSPFIDLTKFSVVSDGRQASDDEKIDAIKLDLTDKLKEYSNMFVTEEEFMSSCVVL